MYLYSNSNSWSYFCVIGSVVLHKGSKDVLYVLVIASAGNPLNIALMRCAY